MRYKYYDKDDVRRVFKLILYALFLLAMLGFSIWYQWLDISAKLAIRDAVRQQQQEAKP